MKWNKGYILTLLLCNVTFTYPMAWLSKQLSDFVVDAPALAPDKVSPVTTPIAPQISTTTSDTLKNIGTTNAGLENFFLFSIPFAMLGFYSRYLARTSITENFNDINKIQIIIEYPNKRSVTHLFPRENNQFAVNSREAELVNFNNLEAEVVQIMQDAQPGLVPIKIKITVYPHRAASYSLTGFRGTCITLRQIEANKDTIGSIVWRNFIAPRIRIEPYQNLSNIAGIQDKRLSEYTITITKQVTHFSLTAPLGVIATGVTGLINPALMPATAAGSFFLTAKYPLKIIPRPRCFGNVTATSFTARSIEEAKKKFIAWATTVNNIDHAPGEQFSVKISARLHSRLPEVGTIGSMLASNKATYKIEKFDIRLNNGYTVESPEEQNIDNKANFAGNLFDTQIAPKLLLQATDDELS